MPYNTALWHHDNPVLDKNEEAVFYNIPRNDGRRHARPGCKCLLRVCVSVFLLREIRRLGPADADHDGSHRSDPEQDLQIWKLFHL